MSDLGFALLVALELTILLVMTVFFIYAIRTRSEIGVSANSHNSQKKPFSELANDLPAAELLKIPVVSERFYTALVGFIIVDSVGDILLVNNEALKIFGWDASLEGKNINLLIPEEAHDRHRQEHLQYMRARISREMNPNKPTGIMTQFGTLKEVHLVMVPYGSDAVIIFARPHAREATAA